MVAPRQEYERATCSTLVDKAVKHREAAPEVSPFWSAARQTGEFPVPFRGRAIRHPTHELVHRPPRETLH